MDVNNENIEPVTDLGLALGYSNQSIQSRLNSDSGAGANAGSVQELDMTFVATEPLSELVWSSDKGPSNVTLSPPQSITGGRSAAEKPIDEENFITSHTSFRVKSEISGKDATSPTSDAGIMLACGSNHEYETETGDNAEEVKTAAEVSILHEHVDTCSPNNFEVDEIPEIPETGERKFTTLPGDVDRERVDMMKSDQIIPFVGQNEPLLGDSVDEDRHADDGNQNRRMDFLLTSKADLVNESKDSGALVADQISQGRRPLDKLELTDDNDIQNLKSENAYGAASQKLGSEYLLRDKESFEKVEEMLPVNDSVLDKHSPTNSRIQKHQSKGKEKALSDGNLSGRRSKEDDDSHESVESCNSSRFFSSGKKRWGYEEQVIVGSKRFRKKIQQTPGCTSYIRQDSSFMNWISTMMKGFSKSIQDEGLPLPLTVVHPDHARENSDKKLITYNKNQDTGLKTIGFQSIFQSLYCPRAESQGTRMSSGNHEIGERSEELEPAIIPNVFHREKMKLHERCLLPGGKFNESTCGNEVRSAIQPEILSAKVANSQEKGNTNSVESKTACSVEYDKKNSGVSSGSSLGKRKKKSVGNVESDLQSEGKTTDKFVHRSDLLGSLWITRFTSKISHPLMSDRYSVGAGFDCSNDKKNVRVKEQSVEDTVVVSGNDLQDCAADNAGSLAFNRNEGQSDEKSICKLNPLFPAPKFGGSEDMASVFARRLDALKHITPSGITSNADDKIMTCFFCGIRGHHLRECSEIKDNELQDLPSKFESYNGAEYLPSFCIRCFQCTHWAVACPNATSVGQPQLGCNVSNYCSPSETKLNAEGNMKLLIGKENQFPASVDDQLCDEDDSRVDTDLNLSWKSKIASKKMRHSSNSVKRYSASTSGQTKLKERQVMPSSQFVNMPVSDVPKGVFDSVKRLRLSRTDVLKWMDSHTSLSNLEGFFLRLRLGKCETGLGGTGYYVSCITGIGTGSQRESCAGNAKNSISVIVGGIRCLVQTQYVSNHDFLEDELRAWWSVISKSNVKIPSEEDLREKVNMRKMLGL